MASSKEYLDYVLERLSEVADVTYCPMMGEYLLYSDGVLFGGIYDDRFLIKIVPENEQFNMPEAIPYDSAKPMQQVEDLDNKAKLAEIVKNTVKGLAK